MQILRTLCHLHDSFFFSFLNLCNKFSATQRNFTLMYPLRANRGYPCGNQYANYKLPILRRWCGGKRTLVEHDLTYFLRWLALRTPWGRRFFPGFFCLYSQKLDFPWKVNPVGTSSGYCQFFYPDPFLDINDCVNHACTNGASCVDGVNYYSCNCKAGFTGAHCETGRWSTKERTCYFSSLTCFHL